MKYINVLPVFTVLAFLTGCTTCTKTASRQLAWAPPELENPITMKVRGEGIRLRLDKTRDYIVELPKDEPIYGHLNIWGGRNVVLIGGEVVVTSNHWRAVYLEQQTGTIHIEGLYVRGDPPENLMEGFNFDQRQTNGVVQLQNIRIEKVHGSYEGNHADLLQTWAGPAELRIDGLTGYTQYQAMFFLPNQHFRLDKDGVLPKKWVFKNINVEGDASSGFMLWAPNADQQFPMEIENVWVQPQEGRRGNRDRFLWPRPGITGDTFWQDVREGIPPGGDFVPQGMAGLNYVSPGYVQK